MVSVVKKYPRGAKNIVANKKLEMDAAISLFLKYFSKNVCISDVETARREAIVIIKRKGRYKIYIK
jgi:hypothetical protein